jgi:hypothetical protein
MCNLLRVRWTITPKTAPQPWIVCSGCGGLRAFQCSNKIRLNANGRKLDAWLIYKCMTCEKTWNRPIFERQNVRDIDPSVIQALQSNDPAWIRAESFNLDALRRKSQRIDEPADIDVQKEVLFEAPGWTILIIELELRFSVAFRLDRLLACELGVSRSRLQALYDTGLLRADPKRADILRRRIKDGLAVTVDLNLETGRDVSWKSAAAGRATDC